MTSSNGGFFSTIIFAFILSGAVYFLDGHLDKAESSKNWPIVQGKILSSEVSSYVKHSDGKRTTMYTPDIVFKYTANGKNYKSSKVYYSDYSTSSSSDIAEVVSKYPEGSIAQVYVNPQVHAEAVLEPGASFALKLIYYVFLFVSALLWFEIVTKIAGFSLLAIFVGYFFTKKKPSKPQAAANQPVRPQAPQAQPSARPVQPRQTNASKTSDDGFDL